MDSNEYNNYKWLDAQEVNENTPDFDSSGTLKRMFHKILDFNDKFD